MLLVSHKVWAQSTTWEHIWGSKVAFIGFTVWIMLLAKQTCKSADFTIHNPLPFLTLAFLKLCFWTIKILPSEFFRKGLLSVLSYSRVCVPPSQTSIHSGPCSSVVLVEQSSPTTPESIVPPSFVRGRHLTLLYFSLKHLPSPEVSTPPLVCWVVFNSLCPESSTFSDVHSFLGLIFLLPPLEPKFC